MGNKAIVESLQKLVAAKNDDRPHVFLFSGSSGCGKTTLARILAKALGCDDMGIREINSANSNGIATIREIAETVSVSPLIGSVKCYIFDESHELTPKAQEALLKPLEDCPKHVYFMFCTTDPNQIIKTIQNRCAKYQVTLLRPSEMRTLLTQAVEAEKFSVTAEVIDAIVKIADGCPRQAIMLLEQIKDLKDTSEILEYISTAETSSKNVLDLCRELITHNKNKWQLCSGILQKLTEDPESVRLAILGYLKKVLLGAKSLEDAGRAAELIQIFEKPTYSGGGAMFARMLFEACLIE